MGYCPSSCKATGRCISCSRNAQRAGVRGVARYRDPIETPAIRDLAGKGNLTVTLEGALSSQRYQGIVPLSGARLADCLQVYFENSEQLPTRLWLHTDEDGSYGMLLQRLPAGDVKPGRQARGGAAIDDAWQRVLLIGDTLTAQELRALSDRQILHRLFNEDDLRVFEPAPVYFRCRCSRERVEGMLRALGEAESRGVLVEQGRVEVRCDFWQSRLYLRCDRHRTAVSASASGRRRGPDSLSASARRRTAAPARLFQRRKPRAVPTSFLRCA